MTRTLMAIVNPRAGGGRTQKQLAEVTRFFREQGRDIEYRLTEKPRHAVEIARCLCDEGAEEILSLGGDGTAFEVINGFMQSQRCREVILGILPLGTGNSFLRDFGIRHWREVGQAIVENRRQWVDIGKIVSDRRLQEPIFFHNMVGFGLIAEACRLRHVKYSFLGKWAYHAAFFHLLLSLKIYSVRCTLDGVELNRETSLAAVCNSKYTGHDMFLSPMSNVQDGELNFLTLEKVHALPLLRLFIQLAKGTHLNDPRVMHKMVRELELEMEGLEIMMVDGEVLPFRSVRIEIIPNALQVWI